MTKIFIIAGEASGDVLGFTNTATVTGSYNSGTGVLTLSANGSPTQAQWQSALESITFMATLCSNAPSVRLAR